MENHAKTRREPSKTMQALDRMALEYEFWAQDLRSAYGYLQMPEKLALIFTWGLTISILLPWFSFSANEPLFGLSAGGGAHLVVAGIIFGTLYRLVVSRRHTSSRQNPEYFSPNRAAIYTASTGLASTFINILLLLYFREWGQAEPLLFQIEPGFYGAIACSLGLIFCGILHFFECFPSSQPPAT